VLAHQPQQVGQGLGDGPAQNAAALDDVRETDRPAGAVARDEGEGGEPAPVWCRAVTRDGAGWERRVDEWRSVPKGLLALVSLLDQLPRNMWRDSPQMYAHDPLALAVTTHAIREYESAPLPLVQWMFL
jgi:hypothetical protein